MSRESDKKLNILLVSWTWFPTGGDWTYVENMRKLYESAGHNVIHFSSKDTRNTQSKYSKYFFDKYTGSPMNPVSLRRNLNAIARKLKALVKDNNIDVAHLNNLNHYSANTILTVLNKNKIPVIWTIHDYKFICSLTSFYRGTTHCEKCMNGKFYNIAKYRCKEGNFAASAMAALQNYYFKYKKIYDKCDTFICPSEFVRQKFIENGFDEKKLITINHFIENTQVTPARATEPYIAYFGRVEKLKGVHTLVDAVSQLPEVKLKIIGGGTMVNELKEKFIINNIKNIELTGFKKHDEALDMIAQSKFAVIPSEYFETFGFTAIEAMHAGRPVIVSKMGSLSELVTEGENGMLFNAGSVSELKSKIEMLYNDGVMLEKMSKNAKAFAEKYTAREQYYLSVRQIFEQLNLLN